MKTILKIQSTVQRIETSSDRKCMVFSGLIDMSEKCSVGNPRDQMTRGTECVTILSFESGRIFLRISRFISGGICSDKAQSSRKTLSDSVSAILQSSLILENIRRMNFVKIHVHYPGIPD